MNILILPFGKYGTCKKAGEEFAIGFGGKGNKVDCIVEINKPINFTIYDVVVFGTNVRYGKFDKRISEQLSILRKQNPNAKRYGFIVGLKSGKALKYETKLNKLINGKSVFVGGELIEDADTKLERAIMYSIENSYKRHKIELPKIDPNKLISLKEIILNDCK